MNQAATAARRRNMKSAEAEDPKFAVGGSKVEIWEISLLAAQKIGKLCCARA